MDVQGLLKLWQELQSAPNDNRGPLLLRVVWALLGLSMIILGLRLWAKFEKTRRLYYDDALMLIAVLLGIGHAVDITLAVRHGFGRHIGHLSIPQIEETMKYGAWSLLPGFLSVMFGRISFCCTVLFLTRTDPRMPTWPIHASIALQVLVNCLGVILFYVQCGRNLDTFWTITKQINYEEYCWDPEVQTKYQYVMGSFNTVTDFFLAVLPAILIEHTRLSRKSKIGLAFLLCLSILAMAASIVKTYEAKVLSQVTDYSYNLVLFVIWISIELNIVIIAASVPFIRPLFRKRPRIRHRQENEMACEPPGWWRSHIPLGSAMSSPTLSKHSSRINMRSLNHTSQQSVSSLEAIFPDGESPGGITVTTSVEVSYESRNVPYVHAALVGLVQGEIENPKLVRV